jgi:hypothetical protein
MAVQSIAYAGYVQLLWYVAVIIISYFVGQALAAKPQKPKPAAFDDFDFPQFDEGTPQCVFWGDCWTEDWMVLDYGNYRTTKIRTKGGKK